MATGPTPKCHFVLGLPNGSPECHNPSLGLTTKARVYMSAVQKRDLRMWESVRCTLTLPSELPFWELESWWTLESS